MFEIGIVGAKNSGKTTLIESLVRELNRRGSRVATIKHSAHQHTFDTEGKDSFRHRAAGAVMTLAVSNGELAFFSGKTELQGPIIRNLMASRCDFCLVEGDRISNRPKILLTRLFNPVDDKTSPNIMASYGPESWSNGTPHFALEAVSALAEFIVEKARRKEGA